MMDELSLNRRRFFARAAALGISGLSGVPASSFAERPPEIKKIRLVHDIAVCIAPQYLAEEFLYLEGFEQVEWIKRPTSLALASVDSGTADMTMDATPTMVYALDRGSRFLILGGIHAGCYELFAHGKIQSVRDLKGKRVSVYDTLGGSDHVLLSCMLAYVGIDPRSVTWVPDDKSGTAMQRFVDHKVDAFMAFAPQPQELRARKIGHVILNTTEDRPWSQYFCCAVVANREFIVRYPVAAKRALRAYLKAADVCSNQPERAARYLVEKGFEPRYEIGLEVIKSLSYTRWRDSNPEDTLRFHALRLHEVGMIKTQPNKLIAQGTDWRFLNELKKELKA
jgi:NitT/TauT family transport system substrate-binding protein